MDSPSQKAKAFWIEELEQTCEVGQNRFKERIEALRKVGLFQQRDLSFWLQRFEEYTMRFELTDSTKLKVAESFLIGEARVWHRVNTPFKSYDQWRKRIIERFDICPTVLISSMQTISMKDFNDTKCFVDQFHFLDRELRRVSGLEPWGAQNIGPGTKLLNTLILKWFIAALIDPIKKRVVLSAPKTLDKALYIVRKIVQQPYYQATDFSGLPEYEKSTSSSSPSMTPVGEDALELSAKLNKLPEAKLTVEAILISDNEGIIEEKKINENIQENNQRSESIRPDCVVLPDTLKLRGVKRKRIYTPHKRVQSLVQQAYHSYMSKSLSELKEADPSISHKEASRTAAKHWATCADNPRNMKT